MNFTSLASSSKGNAYLLTSEGASPLLLEAGLPIKRLREKLREAAGIDPASLGGCLISHEHGDHSKAVKDLIIRGVDCWMSPRTAKALEVEGHHRVHPLFLDMTEGIQRYRVRIFPTEHDATESIGFFIKHEKEALLFVPDGAYIQNRFEDVTLVAVECNFQSEILSQNILSGVLPAIVGRRVRRSHFSLENVISFLKANDLSRCRAIYLMHLSDGNSDERRMKNEIQGATGIPTYAMK